MPKQIIIAEQHHIAAVFSEDQIQELVVATGRHQVGDIYLGVVENVLPGIDAAFVNIGDPERNGFIHVTDLGPLKLKRTAGAITELLAPQQKVLVQVMKEPTGNKGPRLTGNITLPSRYVVLMPYGRGVNLSQRIKNENERNRLRALAILVKPAGMGLLIRTEAEGKPEDAIIEDLEAIQKQWEAIQQEAQSRRPPALLNRDDDFIQRVLRDMYGSDVNRIVVDSSTGLRRVKQYLMNWSGGLSPQGLLIDHHRDRISILEYFRINAAVREALKPRVDLPSGGYVIIEPTEALTVVDVNSGSFTRSATARETVLWTNCEAATEIARQLRLRNLAGVIIVDFIDMESRKDQLQVLEHFNKALRADKARPQIAQLSELGLVELTRKRQGQNIYELFGRSCPTCGGLGHIVHLPGETEERERDPLSMPPREPEWSVAPPVKETPRVIPSNRFPERGETYAGLGEAFDTDSDSDRQDLNLLNHPSYQELGDGNNNRRRRRRRLGGEPTPRDERMPSNSMALLNEQQSEIDTEELPPTPEASFAANSKAGWIEKPERTKPIKLEPVKPVIEPPQNVYVEMSPEEQEIYALMGVSPLVLLNQEVKNPKSVIVNVTLPGEIPDTSTVSEPTPAPSTTEFIAVETDSTDVPEQEFESFPDTPIAEIAQSATTEIESVASDVTPVSDTEIENVASDVTPVSDTEIESVASDVTPVSDTEIESVASDVTPVSDTEIESVASDKVSVNRRRRRRSSATENSPE